MKSLFCSRRTCRSLRLRLAFTLVELLIAMTITLLLMAALARSFAVIGKSIKEGRSQVTLSSKLRGVSFRIRTDLRARTTENTPPVKTLSGSGYFMYYEGPLTESTFAQFGARPERKLSDGTIIYEFTPADDPIATASANASYSTPSSSRSATYRRHARLGDFDDYLAFTAEASGDQFFSGKVPAYMVEDGLTGIARMEPRVIQSKFAEIIMWASPVWSVDSATNLLNVATSVNGGMPLYKDFNNDLVPDSVVLHQRILLIRPDLNIRNTIFDGDGDFPSDYLRPLDGFVASIASNAVAGGAGYRPAELSNAYPITGPYVHPNSDTDTSQMLNSNWLTGMAGVHHFYDLSLRRIMHPQTGRLTNFVAANSLADLVQPHNRFAHVRYPGRYMGRSSVGAFGARTDFATSMPLLALGWNDAILSWQGTADPRAVPSVAATPAWFPIGHPSPRTLNIGSGMPIRSGVFNGWLLPQFSLGDANPAGTSGGDHWERGYLAAADLRWDRTGEDVLSSNILSFDIRGFDPTAPVFLTPGPDADPGVSGFDDDGSGSSDQTDVVVGIPRSELGAEGSDDVVVNVTDMAIFEILNQPIFDPRRVATFGNDLVSLGSRGAFVDLAYPLLGGSPVRQRTAQSLNAAKSQISTPPPVTATATVNQVRDNYDFFMSSEFSGMPMVMPTTTQGMNSLKRSGKLLHSSTGGDIYYFQPTYDTWTDGYESDGFDQTQTIDGRLPIPSGTLFGTTWVLNNPGNAGAAPIPRMPPTTSSLQVDTGKYVSGESETSPPFTTPLPAISVTVRVIDPSSEEMAQFTVIEDLN